MQVIKKIILAAILVFLGQINCSLAYEVQTLDNMPVEDDFVLGPGKVDLSLKPGEKVSRYITVTNRLGEDKNFKVEVEDFSGSGNANETVKLFGDARGPYSLKDYVKPEITEFGLKHGQKIIIPVEIDIPSDSEAGGFYASVLVSTTLNSGEKTSNQGQAKILNRLGALFFVRVAGDINESGHLQDFKVSDRDWKIPSYLNNYFFNIPSKIESGMRGFYEKGPVSFEIYFQNDGKVHLVPSGKIEVRNLLGRKVGEAEVGDYFAMPQSLRKRVVEWNSDYLFGKYDATLVLDKNYQLKPNESEIRTVSFWVIPWKIVLGAIVAIVFILGSARFIFKKFKFEIKKK